jgi:hypothetical protein
MKNTGPQDSTHVSSSGGATGTRSLQDPGARHGASAARQPQAVTSAGSRRRRRSIAAVLIGATGTTLLSLIFITAFIGALHHPGPRGVPVGTVGTPATAVALRTSLNRHSPGGFTTVSYPTAAAARGAIMDRSIDAAVVPSPRAEKLDVATAAGPAVTDATIRDVHATTHAAGQPLVVQNVRPLPPSNPEGISQVFFVVGLLVPSLFFGNLLVTRFGRDLHPAWQLAGIVVYAAIVAAVATAIADAWIGALTGAAWGIFAIGALLAFAAAVTAAAAARWAGGLGYIAIVLLFVPIGIAASGTTLGPNMITPWYADLGKALPAGSALPAVQNTVYFGGSAISTPLLVLAAWALGGAIALMMAAILHPPLPKLPGERARQPAGTSAAMLS